MNSLQKVLSALTEPELRQGVAEMHQLSSTGVLGGGIVRETAKRLAEATQVNPSNALPIVQDHFIRAAAYQWAGLPLFPEFGEACAAPAAAPAGLIPDSTLLGRPSAETAPRQRLAQLLVLYRRAILDGNEAAEREAGKDLLAFAQVPSQAPSSTAPGASQDMLEDPQVYLDAANKLRARPDSGNARAAAKLLEDVYLATKDGMLAARSSWPTRPLSVVQVTLADGTSVVAKPERAYFDAWALQELENTFRKHAPAGERDPEARIQLSCGCMSRFTGFPAEWDSETRECTPAVASGNICERHFHEWDARPATGAAPMGLREQEYPISASVYRRTEEGESEWVLELRGVINDCSFVSRHTQPGTFEPHEIPGLPDHYSRLDAFEDLKETVTAAAGRPLTVDVACRECDCGHKGINDAHATHDACDSCDWSGPRPEKDQCPGCGRENVMSVACPECAGPYRLVTSATLSVRPKEVAQRVALSGPLAQDIAQGGAKEEGSTPRLTPGQCASQFRMYAGAHKDPDAIHQLNFCANFLDEFCSMDVRDLTRWDVGPQGNAVRRPDGCWVRFEDLVSRQPKNESQPAGG